MILAWGCVVTLVNDNVECLFFTGMDIFRDAGLKNLGKCGSGINLYTEIDFRYEELVSAAELSLVMSFEETLLSLASSGEVEGSFLNISINCMLLVICFS